MSDTSESNAADGLDEELARLRADRRRLAASLAGEDPDAPDVGDQGDQAQSLEGDADLARMDRRIREVEHLIADPDAAIPHDALADGTVVTLRFSGGDTATFRVVVIPEEADGDAGAEEAEFLTTDSPLGRALAGRGVGDTVTYAGPDGDLQAEVLELQPPA
ncbi:MAG TPA: GreA/GreB family elongation factor [Pseudonocardia sp.]